MRTSAWIDWLEERIGHWAIPGLIRIFVVVTAVVWILGQVQPTFLSKLYLVGANVLEGEIWRVVTFLFVGGAVQPLLLLLFLWCLWGWGELLESEWGAFKLNLFLLIPIVTLVGLSLVLPLEIIPASYLFIVLVIAIGTVLPDLPIMLFPIPIQMPAKIMSWVFGGLAVALFIFGSDRWTILASFAGYILFFLPPWIQDLRDRADTRCRMRKFRGEDD